MSATTLAVSEETRKRLMRLKIEEGAKSMDELLRQMLLDHRRMKFLDASRRFRERMDAKGLHVEDLLS